ncbi:unnamed protein product [Caenorhabditis bovis]|uniref:Nucleoporin NUP35 n=1 Tax=Caenorhabditis bovis TaxID=2654633 RepID=A0A8S1FAG9_9PELO|nr:unnamed protein product [Caenorhabditis bovis]
MFSNSFNSTTTGRSHLNDMNSSQISNLGTPQDQSTPAFLFGKRKSLAPNGFTGHNLNTATAPTNDIFASSTPSSLPQHVKDVNSSKTVHWSPHLVQPEKTAVSTVGTPTSTQSYKAPPPTSFASPAVNAPPLRSLRDKIEPVKKIARRNTFAATTTTRAPAPSVVPQDQTNQTTRNEDSNDAADTWVTVFGFQPNQVSVLLNLFSRHGEVVSHQVPTKGNFMHIRYSCVTHALQALSRNGTLLDSETYIGVVPCTNKDVMNGAATGIVAHTPSTNRSLSFYSSMIEEDPNTGETHSINENLNNSAALNMSNFDTSLNSSRVSVRSSVGMRPLAAGQRTNATQQKQDGLFNKIWSSMGL